MKRLSLMLALLFLFVIIGKAQNNNRISLKISSNKIDLAYKYSFSEIPVWSETFIGLGNQDINAGFDDFLFGVKIGTPLFTFTSSNVYGDIYTGIYFTNNIHYEVAIPFIGVDIGYEVFLGKRKKHSLFAETGYLYGQREYKQTYNNEMNFASTTDRFKLSAINFSVAYGFNF